MTRWAVLGSNSFTGSCFIDFLLNQEDTEQVIAFSRGPENTPLFLPYLSHPKRNKVKFIRADINKDLDTLLQNVVEYKPDYFVNFAAQSEVAPSWDNPQHWYQTNVVAMHDLYWRLCKHAPFLKRVVHTSSPEVYGTTEGYIYETAPLNPSTPYAASKAGGDLAMLPLIKNFNFPAVLIRATNIYGKHQQLFKIIPRAAIYALTGQTIELHGGGVAVKSYIHSHDVSSGTYAAAVKGRNGEIYHLSPDEGGISVRDVVTTICKKVDVPFEKATRIVAERLGQDKAYTVDSGKARKELGWKCVITREQGLGEVVDWVRDNLEAIKKQQLGYVHRQ